MPKRPTILVVEDDVDLREILCEVLGEMGCTPVGVSDGAAALDWLLAGNRPTLILLDLDLPVMDGWRFREAQAADPRLSDIPVILLSSAHNARRRPIDVPMLLRKPVPLSELTETVRRFVEIGS